MNLGWRHIALFVCMAFIAVLSSCVREEDAMSSYTPLWMELSSKMMEDNGHVYINLEENGVVGRHSIMDWDLAFDCRKDSFGIVLNWTRGMACYNTGLKHLAQYEFSEKVNWRYEKFPVSNHEGALGQWGDFSFRNPKSYGIYYLISLGYNVYGAHLGYRLISIKHFENNAYHIEFLDPLHPSESAIYTVPKDSSRTFQHFSFNHGGALPEVGPKETAWHLMLSPFVSDKQVTPFDVMIDSSCYLSYGLFPNPLNCEVALDSSLNYDAVRYVDALNFDYSSHPLSLGSRWYVWNNTTLAPECNPRLNMVLRVRSGNYYKMKTAEVERDLYGIKFRMAVQML